MDAEFQADKCINCEYVEKLSSGSFKFLGCFYPPYKGKWTAELEECPLGKKLHLCNICIYKYPECNCEMLEFGDGVGHDNITNCDKFIQKWA